MEGAHINIYINIKAIIEQQSVRLDNIQRMFIHVNITMMLHPKIEKYESDTQVIWANLLL